MYGSLSSLHFWPDEFTDGEYYEVLDGVRFENKITVTEREVNNANYKIQEQELIRACPFPNHNSIPSYKVDAGWTGWLC